MTLSTRRDEIQNLNGIALRVIIEIRDPEVDTTNGKGKNDKFSVHANRIKLVLLDPTMTTIQSEEEMTTTIVELKKDAHQRDVTEETEIMIESVMTEMKDERGMTTGDREADHESEVALEIVADEMSQKMKASTIGANVISKMIQMSHQRRKKSPISAYRAS